MNKRNEDTIMMQVLTWFCNAVQIYLRNPLSPREDLAEWRSVLQNIMESSAAATRLVLSTISRQTQQRGIRYLYLEDTILLNLVCCPGTQPQLKIKEERKEILCH